MSGLPREAPCGEILQPAVNLCPHNTSVILERLSSQSIILPPWSEPSYRWGEQWYITHYDRNAYHEAVYTQEYFSFSIPEYGRFDHHTVCLFTYTTCLVTVQVLVHVLSDTSWICGPLQQSRLWIAWSLSCASFLPQHDLWGVHWAEHPPAPGDEQHWIQLHRQACSLYMNTTIWPLTVLHLPSGTSCMVQSLTVHVVYWSVLQQDTRLMVVLSQCMMLGGGDLQDRCTPPYKTWIRFASLMQPASYFLIYYHIFCSFFCSLQDFSILLVVFRKLRSQWGQRYYPPHWGDSWFYPVSSTNICQEVISAHVDFFLKLLV